MHGKLSGRYSIIMVFIMIKVVSYSKEESKATIIDADAQVNLIQYSLMILRLMVTHQNN